MRPLGVTLVGLYQLLRGAFTLLFGICVLLFAGLIATFASFAAEGNAVARVVHGIGHVGLIIIGFAIVHVLAGYGVLLMQNWGRLLTILFSAIGLVLVLPGMAHGYVSSLIFGLLNAACVLYLSMPPIRRAFRAEGSPLRVAA